MGNLRISTLCFGLLVAYAPVQASALRDNGDEVKARIAKSTQSFQAHVRELEQLKQQGKAQPDDEVMLAYVSLLADCYTLAHLNEELLAFRDALSWYERSAKYADECNEPLVTARHVSSFEGYFGMAQMNWKLRQYSDAAMNCQIAMSRPRPMKSQLADAHLLSAQTELITEDFKTSTEQANMALGLYKNAASQASCHRVLAAGHFLQGNLAGAKASWQTASSLDGRGGDSDLFDPLQAPLNAAVARNPKDISARIARAKYLLRRGDNLSKKIQDSGASPLYLGGITNIAALMPPSEFSFEESALIDLARALDVDSDNPLLHILSAAAKEAYNSRGGKTDRYPASSIVNNISWASVFVTTESEALIELGYVMGRRGATREAVSYLSRGLYHAKPGADISEAREVRQEIFKSLPCPAWTGAPKTSPKTSVEWKELGNKFSSAGDWRGALRCYNKALEIDPKNADALNNIGTTMMRQGVIDWALDHLNRAIKIAPAHHMAYYSRAHLWATLKQSSQAIQDTDLAVKHAKVNEIKSQALALKSRVLIEQFKPDEAAQAAEDSLKLVPGNLAAREALGTAHLQQGKPLLTISDLDFPQQGLSAKLMRCVALAMAKDGRLSSVWAEANQTATVTDLGWLLHWLDRWLASTTAPGRGSAELDRLRSFAGEAREVRRMTLSKL